ncbi:MAG: hypothetical protein ACI855_002512 [Myxococcota bacterium]
MAAAATATVTAGRVASRRASLQTAARF